MNIILRPWRHYVDFSGRSTRTEFWLFFVVFYVMMAVLFVVPVGLMGFDPTASDLRGSGALASIAILPSVLFVLAGILPGIAVTVRRLHDSDKSGWMYLLTCIPYVGFLFFLVFGCVPGTDGENGYGFDPRLGDGMSEYETAEVFR